ncbi:unnamed protein product, partial [Vitis vinifera]|uniref:ABC transporter domain-containing protein n=1 Tax=Vitis vinifera TaxID=29760 RepID=D7TNX2_VITVI
MQAKKTRHFSGGWRMRMALIQVLHMDPTILLFDGLTDHLDLEASDWLEETLMNPDCILVVVSHSPDFLNGVGGPDVIISIFLNSRKCRVWG